MNAEARAARSTTPVTDRFPSFSSARRHASSGLRVGLVLAAGISTSLISRSEQTPHFETYDFDLKGRTVEEINEFYQFTPQELRNQGIRVDEHGNQHAVVPHFPDSLCAEIIGPRQNPEDRVQRACDAPAVNGTS